MKIHFIAIGGAIMHQLAICLKQKGYQVSGSDDVIYDPSLSALQSEGLAPDEFGWFPSKITEDIDAVIVGMHAKADNPELNRAQDLSIPIHSFPSYLFKETEDVQRIVVAGSHGKTTITSMLAHVLAENNIEFDLAVGAEIPGFEHQVTLNDKSIILIEGDEYLTSPLDRRPKFVHYRPHVAIINGIAWDHVNVFPTYEDYFNQFRLLIQSMEAGGTLFYNAEDAEVMRLIESEQREDIEYQSYALPEFNVENEVFIVTDNHSDFPMKVIGQHNMNNMEAAKSVAELLGISSSDFYGSMVNHHGAARRLQQLYSSDNYIVFKDFAHAPSKVKASVHAVRATYPNRRLVVCKELHTYSSMNMNFLPLYKDSLRDADEAIVFYDKAAMAIKNMPALDKDEVKACFGGGVNVIDSKDELIQQVMQLSESNGVFLMMSSGSWAKSYLPEWLTERFNSQ